MPEVAAELLIVLGAIVGFMVLIAFFVLVSRVGSMLRSIKNIEALMAEQNSSIEPIEAERQGSLISPIPLEKAHRPTRRSHW